MKGGYFMDVSNKYLKWLESQMDAWVDKNLISSDQKLAIEGFYGDMPSEKTEILPVVLAVIGSALVGLGIILLLARNWSEFSRPLRLVISVMPFIAGMTAAFIIVIKDRPKWTHEAVGVFIPISVIAGLGLIGQTYHSVQPAQSIFLVSALISLPFVYLLDSSIAAIIYIFLSAIFVIASPVEYMYVSLAKAIAMILLIIPYSSLLDREKRKFEGSWINTFAVIYGFACMISSTNQSSYFPEGLLVYGLIIAGIFILRSERFSFPYALSLLLIFAAFFILTFNFRWRYNFADSYDTQSMLVLLFLVASCAAIFYMNLRIGNAEFVRYAAFLVIPFVSIIYSTMAYSINIENAVVWSFNLAFFAVAVSIFVNGSRLLLRSDASITRANMGLILILAIISKWFFDIDISFLARGILFICLGAAFLIFNYVFSRKKKRGAGNDR
ncbi:MAG: DUF2157 domain-containing protein [Clostridia bacterium]|jgi:uncharacterized membrane protein|nr:DUF2157 domain-containing protein [Clostridia bacterium]